MRDKLISFLKHFPLLYRFTRSFYWKLSGLKAHILGTKIGERKWKNLNFNEIYNGVKGSKRIIKELNEPHRQILIEKINKFQKISSFLEIGCGYGVNLYLLAKKFPKIEMTGIDISPTFIQGGNKLFIKEGISNVKLINRKADELSRFPDKSFDIVLTDATLICIGRDMIKKIVKEMIRITKHTLILVEWHQELQNKDPNGLGSYYLGYWKRNYINLFSQFVDKDKIQVTKLLPKHWPGKNWEKFGYIIEVRI